PSKAVWEAKKVKRGCELMGVVCFSLMPIFENITNILSETENVTVGLPLHTLNIIFVLLSGTFTVNGKVNPASEANKRAMVSRGEMTFQDVYGAEALLNEEDEEDDSGWNLSSRRYPLSL
ncbi:unnamed protein product, partial [Brassica oleracea]